MYTMYNKYTKYAFLKKIQKWELVSQSQIKKVKKLWAREHHKNAEKASKEQIDAERREKNLEEAKKIIITIDDSLPKPVQVFQFCRCLFHDINDKTIKL